MKSSDLDIPIQEPCNCSGKSCGAVRHIEDLSHDVDVLRAELRRCEKANSEDTRRLRVTAGRLTVALGALLPTGWASFLGLI